MIWPRHCGELGSTDEQAKTARLVGVVEHAAARLCNCDQPNRRSLNGLPQTARRGTRRTKLVSEKPREAVRLAAAPLARIYSTL